MLLNGAAFAGLCRARDLLVEVPDQPLSIRDIAQAARMSPFHFIRQFEATFGLTPHQFRIQTRLDRAKLLLAMGQSVTEVCMEVGFNSLGSFSDLFARKVGTPPSVYRLRARAMVAMPGPYPRELFPGCLSLMGRLPVVPARGGMFSARTRAEFGEQAQVAGAVPEDQLYCKQ
jgi:AraC-like DNA-binding protein